MDNGIGGTLPLSLRPIIHAFPDAAQDSMLTYPEIDPIIFSLGPLSVRWYGVMYLLGFAATWWFAMRRTATGLAPTRNRQEVEDLVFYGAMGVILGGRIGYILFYQFGQFLDNPLVLFRITQGGMSFHGGLIGVLLAMGLFAHRIRQPFFAVMDLVAPLTPIGLGLGRLGNFINQELWGRVADVPWAMVFPADPLGLPRHPSQLYQFALEGVLLFLLLQWFARKPRPQGLVSGLFLSLYAIFRFSVEFFREPDAHIGFDVMGWMTRGQELCVPMLMAGVAICVWSLQKNKTGEH
jgi:phosphatidylglycerol:prolipoprotein diacylglycerol transferase